MTPEADRISSDLEMAKVLGKLEASVSSLTGQQQQTSIALQEFNRSAGELVKRRDCEELRAHCVAGFRTDIAELRKDIKSEVGGIRSDMKSEVQALRGDLTAEVRTLADKIPRSAKWGVKEWVGIVGVVVMLLGIILGGTWWLAEKFSDVEHYIKASAVGNAALIGATNSNSAPIPPGASAPASTPVSAAP